MNKILLLPLLLFPFLLQAQNGTSTVGGARGLAMGDAALSFRDLNSAFSNQAGLTAIEQPGVIVLAEQRFSLSEIRSLAAATVYPTSSGVFGLKAQYFGFDAYNEQAIGLSYARKLMDNLHLGVQLNYLNFSIPEYGNKSLFSFEVGVQIDVFEDLILAAHLTNPLGQEVVLDDELPTVFKLGLGYQVTKKVLLSAEVEKDIDFPARVKAGVEYQLIEALHVRAGISTEPSQFSFGMGYKIKNQLTIDAAANYHQQLGFSPGLLFFLNFKPCK